MTYNHPFGFSFISIRVKGKGGKCGKWTWESWKYFHFFYNVIFSCIFTKVHKVNKKIPKKYIKKKCYTCRVFTRFFPLGYSIALKLLETIFLPKILILCNFCSFVCIHPWKGDTWKGRENARNYFNSFFFDLLYGYFTSTNIKYRKVGGDERG